MPVGCGAGRENPPPSCDIGSDLNRLAGAALRLNRTATALHHMGDSFRTPDGGLTNQGIDHKRPLKFNTSAAAGIREAYRLNDVRNAALNPTISDRGEIGVSGEHMPSAIHCDLHSNSTAHVAMSAPDSKTMSKAVHVRVHGLLGFLHGKATARTRHFHLGSLMPTCPPRPLNSDWGFGHLRGHQLAGPRRRSTATGETANKAGSDQQIEKARRSNRGR